MTVEDLLKAVEEEAGRRNTEVVAALLRRICEYRKAELALSGLLGEWSEKQISASLGLDTESIWYRHRQLKQKLRFKRPCGFCQVCVIS